MFRFDDGTGFLQTKAMLRAMPTTPQKVEVKVNNTPQKKPIEVKVVEVVKDKKSASVATNLNGTHYLKPNKTLEYQQKNNGKQQTSILTNILSVGKEQSIMLRAINENLRGTGQKNSAGKGIVAGVGALAVTKIAQLLPVKSISSLIKKTLAIAGGASLGGLTSKPLLKKAGRVLGRASLFATPAIMAYDAFTGYQDYKQQRGYSKDQKTKLSDKVTGATAGIVNGLSETVEFLTFGLYKPASKEEIFNKAGEIQDTISKYTNDLMADQNSWLGQALKGLTPIWELENNVLSDTYDAITAVPDLIRSMQPYIEKIKEPFDVLFDAIKSYNELLWTIATPIRKLLDDAWKTVSDEVVEQAIRGRIGLSKDSRKYLDLRDQKNTLEKDIKANGADPKKIKQLTAIDKQLGIYASKALQDKVFLRGNTRYNTYAGQDLTYANQALIARNAIKNKPITDAENNIALAKQNIDSLKSKLLAEKDVAKKAQLTKQIQAWELSLLNSEKQLTELEKVNKNLEKLISVNSPSVTNNAPSSDLFTAIAQDESGNNPNAIFNKYKKQTKPLTTMSLGEVNSLQSDMKKTVGHSPVGKYQMTQGTLQDTIKYANNHGENITNSTIFDEQMQEKLMKYMMEMKGYSSNKSQSENFKIIYDTFEVVKKNPTKYSKLVGQIPMQKQGSSLTREDFEKYGILGKDVDIEHMNTSAKIDAYNNIKAYYEKTGKKFPINTAFRSIEKNKAVGGAAGSTHLKGLALDSNTTEVTEAKKMGLFKNWKQGTASQTYKGADGKMHTASELHHLTFTGKDPLQQSLDKTGDKIDEFKEAVGDLASRLQQSFTDMFGSWDMLTGAITDSTSVTKEATKEAKKTGVTQDEINVLFDNHALEGGKV